MPTHNVVLTDHQHELVNELVRSGRYRNASEVLRDGLRLAEWREQEDAGKLQALRAAADQGWADAVDGRCDGVTEAGIDDFVRQLGTASRQQG